MAKNYKIFISHSWSYSSDLTDLQNLLNSRGYFNVEFQEASQEEPINSANAAYIKQVLKSKILNSFQKSKRTNKQSPVTNDITQTSLSTKVAACPKRYLSSPA